MPPFRLVASDIDGTLIRSDGKLSPRTTEILDQLYSRGIPTVLVTGRPVRWLRQLYDQMVEPLPAVCANGAVVYDPDTDEILRAAPLSVDLLLDVTRKLREAVPDITLAVEVENGRSFRYEQRWPLHWDGEHKTVRVVASHEELISVPSGEAAGPLRQLRAGRVRRAGEQHSRWARRGDALVVVGAGGDLRGRCHQGRRARLALRARGLHRAGRGGLRGHAERPAPCCPGQAVPWRWATPTPPSGRSPTR
nr:hypothetical protein GCM10020092_003250 [Actinoplanes digitatis]